MAEFEQVHEISHASQHIGVEHWERLKAGHWSTLYTFDNHYFERSQPAAPELSEQFDDRAHAIYDGLDPKTVFFPSAQRENYPQQWADELRQAADALNDHGARSLRLAREVFRLNNIEWLGLASKSETALFTYEKGAFISSHGQEFQEDDLGYFRRSPGTDVGIVGPKDAEEPLTLAMGVADCLAIPIVDPCTLAFGFAHAGRPGTGLRTVSKAVDGLEKEFDSEPRDLIAYLGEGVCASCYQVSEEIYNGFKNDFGGETEISKVLDQYPNALQEKITPEGKKVGIDLYAFNKYLLATQGVGEILVAANCTARVDKYCPSNRVEGTPWSEAEQKFYSHERAKGKTVGWSTEGGWKIDLNTFHLTTPRNLATFTRR